MLAKDHKTTVNTFNKGLNKDLNKNLTPTEQYVDAHNISLMDDGTFLSATNIKGTTNISNIINDVDSVCLGVFAHNYKIGNSVNVPCLTIITCKPGVNFKIWAYDTVGNELYELFEEPVDSDYYNEERIIDGVNYPENGIDIFYFTDFSNEIRKLRCVIPNSYGANFLNKYDLSLQRFFSGGSVDLQNIQDGGSLLCGSYQIAYQLSNPTTNKYSKPSLFCNPIMIFNSDNAINEGNIVGGGIGVVSNFKIVLNIKLAPGEADNYTHFRLLVKENVDPEGVVNQNVQVTPLAPISEYLNGNIIESVQYKSNVTAEAPLSLSDVVIDLAAIQTVKTLAIRNNRLIAGNILYKDLEYDNGDPSVISGNIIKRTYGESDISDFKNNSNSHLDLFSDHYTASKYRGYFRDEVYRFFISYFDEFGNYSNPKALDMSNIVNNQINTPGLIPPVQLMVDSTFTFGLDNWLTLPGEFNWDDSLSGKLILNQTDLVISYTSQIVYQNVTLNSSATSYQLSADIVKVTNPNGVVQNIILQACFIVGGVLDSTTNVAILPLEVTGSVPFNITVNGLNVPAGTEGIGFRIITQYTSGTEAAVVEIGEFKITESAAQPPVSATNSDMKFPSRNGLYNGERYTLFHTNNLNPVLNNGLVSLGLNITVDNHPTWAKGFVILRAKRIKDILFQTPLVPMVSMYGVGALDNYPNAERRSKASIGFLPVIQVGEETVIENATPMGPNTTMGPMNYFLGKPVDIVKNDTTEGSQFTKKIAGEAYMRQSPNTLSHFMVFPQSSLYTENNKFVFTDNLSLKTVDAVAMNGVASIFSEGPDSLGKYQDTSCALTLFSMRDQDYYYNSQHNGAKPPLRPTTTKIDDYGFFPNGSIGSTVGGRDVYKYDNLKTGGVNWGYPATAQASGVIHIKDGLPLLSQSTQFASSPSYIPGFINGDPTFSVQSAEGASHWTESDGLYLSDDKVAIVEVVNVVKNLANDRYGEPDFPHECISTGTIYTFTDSDLSTVASAGSLPISVDIWGGDCIVSTHTFKISDTVYSVTHQGKYKTTPEFLSGPLAINAWDRMFLTFDDDDILSIPVALKNVGQYMQVVLESEYNGEVMDTTPLTKVLTVDAAIGDHSPHTVLSVGAEEERESVCRLPMPYKYNIHYSKQNDDKIFRLKDPFIPTNTKFESRLAFTDEKIYQSLIEGFDKFRVLNYYDLEETYGGLTALRVTGDNLYGIQEFAISYIGIGERVLETTDATTLSIASGDIIGNVILIDSKRGSAHLGGIVNTGSVLYVPDVLNKSIYRVSGKELQIITDNGLATEFRTRFNGNIPLNNLSGLYDPVKKEVWMLSTTGDYCYIYNEGLGAWVSNYEFSSGLFSGVYTNKKLNLIARGSDNNQLAIHTMYTGPNSYLLGDYVVPRVSFIVNPESSIGKVFDSVLINSSDRLESFDILVERESVLGNQLVTGIDLDVSSRGEGNFRTKILRVDGTKARPRGLYAIETIKWKTGPTALQVSVPQVITKYRLSENIF